MLAEVALPGSIRSQQAAYGDSPRAAGCLFPVGWWLIPTSQARDSGGLLLPLGVRRLRAYASDPQRPLLPYPGDQGATLPAVEADLDVLDEHGTVLLAVRGLQLGTGVSESEQPQIAC